MFLNLSLYKAPQKPFYSKVLQLFTDKDDSGERVFLDLRVKKAMLWLVVERKILYYVR